MDKELQEAFNTCVDAGINWFDTADSYGTGNLAGQSEKLLGAFIAQYPGPARRRDDVKIATKFAPCEYFSSVSQWRLPYASLSRLMIALLVIMLATESNRS
jgi:pyridoxine 4-dehydrogenase